ncbi:hypothetical protein AC1031_009700 [Aphanomyces cochlioides]|nr:hypothetical protein AC1031_009700 [Aphanomyces cochlioides]
MGLKKVFPLPNGFFHTPPMSDFDRYQYIRQGQKALLEFVKKARLRGGPINWAFDHEENGVMVYRGMDPTFPPGQEVVYLNVTEVEATLDEASALMTAGDDGSRDYCATYNKDEVVDMQLLYHLAKATAEHPHNSIAIKWRAFTSNTPLSVCATWSTWSIATTSRSTISKDLAASSRPLSSLRLSPTCTNLSALCAATCTAGRHFHQKSEKRRHVDCIPLVSTGRPRRAAPMGSQYRRQVTCDQVLFNARAQLSPRTRAEPRSQACAPP